MLKTRWILLPLLVLGSISSAQAEGTRIGAEEEQDVIIDPPGGATRMASGAMGTARLEPLDQYVEKEIGCALDVTPGLVTVTCLAKNSTDWLYCISTDPVLVSALNAINSDSKITFVSNPFDRNHCLSISIDNSSKYQQKVN